MPISTIADDDLFAKPTISPMPGSSGALTGSSLVRRIGLSTRDWCTSPMDEVVYCHVAGTAFAIKPWYRIPERKKDDDNRDIEECLGYFEFTRVYKYRNQLFELFFRNTLKDDYRGALQLGWSFPVTDRLNGYVQLYGQELCITTARL